MISATPVKPSDVSVSVGNSDVGYYSISQVAALLGVSRVSVSRWIRAGRLPVARLGHRTTRIRREDVERLLDRHGLHARRLASTADGAEHIVQFYEDDASLLDSVTAYVGSSLNKGGVGIVIATEEHRRGLELRLRARGIDIDAASLDGCYIRLDAATTLEQFLVDGEPDADRFAEVVGSLVAGAVESDRPVCAFGEMVALLAADGNHAAAVRLESLWNGLQQLYRFSLLCAYPMGVLSGFSNARNFGDVCGEHSRVVPMESFSRTDDTDAHFREIARMQQLLTSMESEVAERRRVDEQLRRSERELREFLENATEGIHWVGPDGRIIWANRAEMEMLGYSAGEYIGHSIAEFHVDSEVIAEILRRLEASEELHNFEARLRAKDGSIKYVLINSNAYHEDGRFIHTRCFTRDITARKQAEDVALRLAAIVASSDDAIIGKTLDGTVTDWNEGAGRLYGYPPDEMIGQPITRLIPDDRPDEFPSIMERLRRGERIDHFETERIRKDGQRLTVSVTISPVRDARGRIVGASAIARDVSDRKRIEQEREVLLERERAAHAEATAALQLRNEFLSVAAHELRTPIAAMKGYSQLAERRLTRTGQLEPERATEALRGIASQSDKLSKLVGRLLDVSRIEEGKLCLELQVADMTTLVTDVVSAARSREPARSITLDAPTSLEACIDPLRIEQVVTNLVDNAIKYSQDDGSIDVSLSRTDEGTVELAVRDYGLGIPPERRGRIFERYYQAHGEGYRSGLGLGLYVSSQIIELHGGEIRAEFPEGRGSRFVVRLPNTR